ncbi:unnamed protein product, partial [Nesidiocoris tenuis]
MVDWFSSFSPPSPWSSSPKCSLSQANRTVRKVKFSARRRPSSSATVAPTLPSTRATTEDSTARTLTTIERTRIQDDLPRVFF